MSTALTSASLIADRFELLEEMPRVTDGRLFRARDLAFGEAVAVKLLGTGCGMDPAGRHSLELAMRRVQITRHAHLLRYDSLDVAGGVQVREWIHGFSLLDLLRRRRELTADDTFRLLSTLPDTLDFLTAREMPIPRPLLGKVFIQFDPATSPEALVAQPIAGWPPFSVKVNPFSVRGHLSGIASDTTRTTITDTRTAGAAQPEAAAPQVLAELLYELLGGRQRDADSRRYSPISALHEEGNGVLRRALLVAPHPDCRSLWRDLRKAQSSSIPPPVPLGSVRTPPRSLEICPGLPAAAGSGMEAILTPQNPETPEIRLVARPQFTIGRSLHTADFVTRIFPETAANAVLTDRISRVHAVFESVGGHLVIRDGSGSAPSVNGSHLDGHILSPDHPSPLTHRAVLSLGEEYFLEIIPVLHPAPRVWPAARDRADESPREPRGALVCQPRNGQPVIRHSVWVFSEIGFGVDYCGRIVWDIRGTGESPAAFHHREGGFWLRNHSLTEDSLGIDNASLAPNQVAPLCSGQTVRLGSTQFKVEIR